MRLLFNLLCVLFLTHASAQSPIGKWVTIDDNTGKQRSVVQVYKNSDGSLSGKIIKLFREPHEEQDPVCKECKGADKNKKVIGLVIMKNMKKDGDEWEDGTIMDPENGKTYDCKIWVEDGVLKVRGYIAFLYRTQEWKPYKG